MKMQTLFWGIPILLAAIFIVVFYQMSLEEKEDSTLSVAVEQTNTGDMEKESKPGPEPKPETAAQEDAENEGESTEEAPETTDDTAMAPEHTEPEPATPSFNSAQTKENSSTIKKEAAAEESAPSITGLEHAALIETQNHLWVPVDITKPVEVQSNWQTIIVQNKYKLDYTIIPEHTNTWSIVEERKKLKIQFQGEAEDQKDILSRKKQGKYAVQIMSVEPERFEHAVSLVKVLVAGGYYAYLHRTDEKFDDKYWYRIRVGFFKTADEAQSAGEEIYFRFRDEKVLPKNYWAVLPSSQELNRELIDLRTRQNKPWFLELPEYGSKEQAIADLPIVAEISNFAYLSYRHSEGGTVRYRMRIGFFETHLEAQNHLKKLEKIRKDFKKAEIIKL
ncbi:MAG: SPOR domain-containing protein [SAR324 cluster bacterium]|nr:SPOR domain-containing protein [SAR324 cluster bacterium]